MFRRLLATARTRRFYVKLVTFTLLVALLPVLVISLVLYHNTTSVMRNEVRSANEMNLRQTVDTMEMIVNQIGTSFQQTVLSGAIKEFEGFPLGSYYESLRGDYREDDLRELYSYVNSKSNAQWYLDNLKRSNPFIQSVYFFDYSKQVVLTGTNFYSFPDFYDNTWSLTRDGINAYPLISELREAKQRDGSVRQVIPIVYMSSALTNNYIVINLDAEMIYRSVFSKLIRDGEHAFFVLSGSGRLMFYDRQYPISETMSADPALQREMTAHKEGSFEMELAGKRRLVASMTSGVLGWTFVNALPVDNLFESVNNTKRLILFTTMLLVAASGVLVLVASRSLYDPIRQLLSLVNIRGNTPASAAPGSKPYGELRLIRSSLLAAYASESDLQVRLQESMPAYKKMYVDSLLHPNRFTRDEIDERFHFLGIGLEQEGIALLVVTVLVETGQPEADVERIRIDKLRIEDMIEAIIPADCGRIVTELIENRFVVIMNSLSPQMSEVFEAADRIARGIRDVIGIRCTIGIGNYCPDATHLQRAYIEATEAQRHRIVSGDSDVIYIQDVRLVNVPLLQYPKDKEMAINNYMLNGEAEQAKRLFAEFVADLKQQRPRVDFRQMQMAFLRLLGSFAETAVGLRLDIEQVLRRNANLYEVLLQKNEIKEIAEWFAGIIADFAAFVGQAYVEKNNKYGKQAVQLIESSFHDNISLTSIAEKLQLSPSYFSRIFKEYTGLSFSEYVMTARIESGKKLLLETGLLIKEIGESVGYHKTNYFIKVFKDCTGMTPGEYRKMHGIVECAAE